MARPTWIAFRRGEAATRPLHAQGLGRGRHDTARRSRRSRRHRPPTQTADTMDQSPLQHLGVAGDRPTCCRGEAATRPKAHTVISKGVSAPRVDTTDQSPLQHAGLAGMGLNVAGDSQSRPYSMLVGRGRGETRARSPCINPTRKHAVCAPPSRRSVSMRPSLLGQGGRGWGETGGHGIDGRATQWVAPTACWLGGDGVKPAQDPRASIQRENLQYALPLSPCGRGGRGVRGCSGPEKLDT